MANETIPTTSNLEVKPKSYKRVHIFDKYKNYHDLQFTKAVLCENII